MQISPTLNEDYHLAVFLALTFNSLKNSKKSLSWRAIAVVEISVGCRRKPTGFHKKAERPIVKYGKKAGRFLHKVVKYLLINSTVPVFAIV